VIELFFFDRARFSSFFVASFAALFRAATFFTSHD
jgi:hypothetical protein